MKIDQTIQLIELTQPFTERRSLSPVDVCTVSPALENYTQSRLFGEVWKREGLSRRDRSLVTVAALIARSQVPALAYYLELALDYGVTPLEISETITHLAFYCGWPNAMGAVTVAKDIFQTRGIELEKMAPISIDPLPIDDTAEAKRAENVIANFGDVAPGVVKYTTEALFRDLWLRPDLAPRDRSLITVAALVAAGQSAQITYHLNRAMDNGLTRGEASEVFTQLAFYVGWPNVMSALPIAKDVFEKRP